MFITILVSTTPLQECTIHTTWPYFVSFPVCTKSTKYFHFCVSFLPSYSSFTHLIFCCFLTHPVPPLFSLLTWPCTVLISSLHIIIWLPIAPQESTTWPPFVSFPVCCGQGCVCSQFGAQGDCVRGGDPGAEGGGGNIECHIGASQSHRRYGIHHLMIHDLWSVMYLFLFDLVSYWIYLMKYDLLLIYFQIIYHLMIHDAWFITGLFPEIDFVLFKSKLLLCVTFIKKVVGSVDVLYVIDVIISDMF